MPRKSKKTDQELPTVEGPSFVFNEGGRTIMVEEVYDPDTNFVGFSIWDGKSVILADHYEQDGVVYIPRVDDGVRKGVILLPQRAEDYGSVEELIEEIKQFCQRWLDVRPEFLEIATWYVLLSWVHDRVNTIAYLRAIGDWGTGKSRFLDVLGGLCYRAMNASGATTSAAVTRLIELWGGTLIINEADWEKSDERQEIVRILNEGFERRRSIIKAHQDKQKELIYYSPFGPKVIATRKQFDDPALESRCLTEVMEETTREDILPIVTKQFSEDQQKLRNKLLMFRFKFWEKVREEAVHDIFPKLIKKKIERRLIQATITFSVLFAEDRELFGRFLNFLEKYQRELREERATSYDGMIVNAIFKLGVGGDDEIYAQKIADQLIELGWTGNPPNPRTIGRHLRTLKIETKNKRIRSNDGKDKVVKAVVWDKEQIQRTIRLIRKYVPDADDCSVEAFVANVAKGIANVKLDTFIQDHDISNTTNATNDYTLQKPDNTNATFATDATKSASATPATSVSAATGVEEAASVTPATSATPATPGAKRSSATPVTPVTSVTPRCNIQDLKARLFKTFGEIPFKPSEIPNHFQGDDLVRVNNLLASEMVSRGEVMKVVTEGGARAWKLVRKG